MKMILTMLFQFQIRALSSLARLQLLNVRVVRLRRLNPRRLDFILDLKLVLLMGAFFLPHPANASGSSDYKAYCAGCHGANGNVQTEKAKALKMDVRKLSLKSGTKSKDQMIVIIESGKGDMPDFKKQLSGERISAIADYVEALRNKR